MKKITKSLAIAGALMCSSVALVACGGDNGLVDTKGNYTATTASETTAYVNALDDVKVAEKGSYKFKMRFEATDREETASIKVDGHIDADGNFDMSISINGGGQSVSSQTYYEAANKMLYSATKTQGVDVKVATKITHDGDQLDGLPIGNDFLSAADVKAMITELKDANVSISETNTTVKIKYVATEGSEESTIYLVLNKNGDTDSFAGARCELTSDQGVQGAFNGYVDVVLSKEGVKTLTDDQKAQYLKA